MILAFVEALAGHTTEPIEHLNQVMRISPRDPMRYGMYNQFAMTFFLAGRYAEGSGVCSARNSKKRRLTAPFMDGWRSTA